MWDAVGYCTLPTICKYLILHAPHNKLLRPWLWWFFFKLPREMLEGACTPGCWAMPSNKEFKRTGGLSFNHRGQHTRVTISTMWSQRHRIPYPMWPVTGSIEVYWILLPDDFVLLEKWFFFFFFCKLYHSLAGCAYVDILLDEVKPRGCSFRRWTGDMSRFLKRRKLLLDFLICFSASYFLSPSLRQCMVQGKSTMM